MKITRAMKSHILAYKAYGHAKKGEGKRLASKTRRRVGKALCQNLKD